MHDRRVDGEALVFGNQGALYLNAMTWWDHRTRSIWSQPWGTALTGLMEGTALTLIPASIVPWDTWKQDHSDTTVLTNFLDSSRRVVHSSRDDFVIGVALQDTATAYHYRIASEERVINDTIGEHPIAVFVNADTRDVRVYLRRATVLDEEGPPTLTFLKDADGRILDDQTGSIWDVTQGVAVEGEFRGTVLQQIPWVSSFDWAWLDFFPHTVFYGEESEG